MFTHGYGLNGQEEYLLQMLVDCCHKEVFVNRLDETERKLAEVIRDEVILQEKRLPELLDMALSRIDEELYCKLNKNDRSISIAYIQNLIEQDPKYTHALELDEYSC